MARNSDDDILTGPVPLPDDEPTAAELAHAKTFASLVDKTLAGRAPAAMSADDRALLEVATVIRATAGALELGAARRTSLVEDALRQAMGGVAPATLSSPVVAAAVAPVVSIASRRRWLPWTVAAASTAVAAAALVALWVRAPQAVAESPAAASAAHVPARWTSRSADALIGPIPRAHAADATARIDAIFEDRLDGYRDRTYATGRVR